MKIIVLGNVPAELAGSRRQLLRAMIERGHDVVAAAPGLGGGERERLEQVGVKCDDFPLSRTGLNPLADLATYRALVALMRRHRPDLVLAMTIKPVIYGLLAARRANVPRRIAHITGLGYAFTGPRSGKRALVGWIVERLYRRALGGADHVLFENDDDRDLFVERSLVARERTAVIDGSGVDLDHFRPQPWPDEPMRFLFVGRLLKAKGVPELVAAMRRVRANHRDVTLSVAGPIDDNPDAIDRATLDRWIEDGVIDYLGTLDDVRAALGACHVFVLPSHREGLPRSTMEAMATGRAVITTDAPGCRRTVVEGENGMLVPVGDIDALEQAIRWMIANPDKARGMGGKSLEIVRERYSLDHVNAQILSLLDL